MFEKLIDALNATRRTIVFTEGHDARILEAAARLKQDNLMDVILVGNADEVKANAAKGKFDIEGLEILDPATYCGMDEMVAKMVELRKGKMTDEECRACLLYTSQGAEGGREEEAQGHLRDHARRRPVRGLAGGGIKMCIRDSCCGVRATSAPSPTAHACAIASAACSPPARSCAASRFPSPT